MDFILYGNQSLEDYTHFLDNHKYSGVWHYPDWLSFQLKTKKAYDGKIFSIKENNKIFFAGIILFQKKQNIIRYGYIPGGFLFTEFNQKIYNFFLENIIKIAKQNHLLFIQIDSVTPDVKSFYNIITQSVKHDWHVRLPIPEYTNIIDLTLSLDKILSKMKSKGRYNIKLASKKGVVIKEGNEKDIEIFYNLLKITTKRDGFSPNTLEYYKDFLRYTPNSKLLLAIHENDIISAGIFTYTKNQALYYYGASSNIKRNLMAPYLVQWEAIKIGKQMGCSYFDFMGIANPDNKNDSLKGVTDFKLKFGENIIKFLPSYIIYFQLFKYSLYNFMINIKNGLKL